MSDKSTVFNEIVEHRRAVRIFSEKEFNPDAVTKSLKRALLAPTSSNMQLYELYRISDNQTELKQKIAYACFNQNAAKTAREFIVVVVRPDLWPQRANFNYQTYLNLNPNRKSLIGGGTLTYYKRVIPFLYFNDPFGMVGSFRKLLAFIIGLFRPIVREVSKEDIRVVLHKSAALVSQTFMLSMSAEEHDTCPMEGFDSKLVKRILKLPARAEINMIISCGVRTYEGIYNERVRLDEGELIKNVL